MRAAPHTQILYSTDQHWHTHRHEWQGEEDRNLSSHSGYYCSKKALFIGRSPSISTLVQKVKPTHPPTHRWTPQSDICSSTVSVLIWILLYVEKINIYLTLKSESAGTGCYGYVLCKEDVSVCRERIFFFSKLPKAYTVCRQQILNFG